MCHSPSGAFSVQTPDRACWALADNATATESPAASPPDTTFCATRFITDLREKGDSKLKILSYVLRQVGRRCGLVLLESRPGPVLRDRRSNAEVDWRPALDCREHPPTGRTGGGGTAGAGGSPADGSE